MSWPRKGSDFFLTWTSGSSDQSCRIHPSEKVEGSPELWQKKGNRSTTKADDDFRIDGYKFLARSMIPEFKAFQYQAGDFQRAVAKVPLKSARVTLLTSSGLYLKNRQQSFDLEREQREPLCGDPTYSVIPRNIGADEIAVAHLHFESR